MCGDDFVLVSLDCTDEGSHFNFREIQGEISELHLHGVHQIVDHTFKKIGLLNNIVQPESFIICDNPVSSSAGAQPCLS